MHLRMHSETQEIFPAMQPVATQTTAEASADRVSATAKLAGKLDDMRSRVRSVRDKMPIKWCRFLHIDTGVPALAYRRNAEPFSPTEMKALRLLRKAIGDSYYIFPRMRLTDLVTPYPSLLGDRYDYAFERIRDANVDFVLCDPDSFEIMALVMLSKNPHINQDDEDWEVTYEELGGVCDMPVFHLDVAVLPTAEALRKKLGSLPVPARETSTVVHKPANTRPAPNRSAKKHVYPIGEVDRLVCPNCRSEMVRINLQSGSLAGKPFWRCRNYPGCRTVIPIL